VLKNRWSCYSAGFILHNFRVFNFFKPRNIFFGRKISYGNFNRLTGLGLHLCVYLFNLQVAVSIMTVALGLSFFIRITQIWEAVLVLTAPAVL
jgi:hypothetical protein